VERVGSAIVVGGGLGGVAYEAVKWRETFDVEANEAALDSGPAAAGDRYDLATALRIVRRMETSATRGAIFAEIKNKNPLYRLIDALYSIAGKATVQPLLLLAYMLKCVLSLGPFDAGDAEAVSISNFGNERHSVDRVAALVPETHVLRLGLKRRHLFGRGQLRAARQLLGAARRIWPFLSRLVRLHGFMPSARIASALAFYIRFVQLFADRPDLAAAIVASNYSPEAVGMAAAAHRMGRKVIYINHAPVPANGTLVPPVLADCAVFYGDAVRQTYERRSRCTAEVALIGQPWTARPMQWRDELQTIGIFLTALTRADVVSDLVSAIRATHPDVRILIRNHPVALLKTDFSQLAAQDRNIEVTIGTPLDAEILACDLIICGNSGVAMNALSGGRPVAYMDSLDGLSFDYNGFVENGLVCHVASWSGDIDSRLKKFYFNPRWQSIMRTYDASYGADVAELEEGAAATIRRYLSSTPCPAPEAFPVRLRA
jgi:hypothetical protein